MTNHERLEIFDFQQIHLLDGIFAEPLLTTRAEIRRIYPTVEPDDLTRLVEIENDPEKIMWFESRPENHIQMTKREALSYVLDKRHHTIVAVAGLPGRPDIKEANEEEKLQGFISFNPETNFRMNQLTQESLLPENLKSPLPDLVLEVSYAKWNSALSGQMADSLRNATWAVLQHTQGYDLVINAYVINDTRGYNMDSEHVLLASGFEEKGEIFYDSEMSNKDKLFTLNPKLLAQKLGKL